MVRALGVSLVGLGAYLAVLLATSGTPLAPVTGALVLGIVLVVLLIPIQSLAEELVFRAFLPQVVFGAGRVSAVAYGVVSLVGAALFASLHSASSPVLLGVYLLLGLVFSALVWVTGGIEAAAVMHAVNNVVFVTAGLLQGKDLTATQGETRLDTAFVAQVVVLLVIAAVIVLVTRRETGRLTDRTKG